MKFTPILGRVTAVLVLLGILVGTTPSFQPAWAAPAGQEGTESWGQGHTPAPGHVNAVMSVEPPASARMQADAQQQPGLPGRFPGPVTPEGAVTDADLQPWIPPTSGGGRVPLSASDFVIFHNSSLADGPDRSQVSEPSTANNGPDIFVTYNLYAGLSTDYGDTWNYIDPVATFPFPPLYGGLTTHQDALYDPGRDLMFWLLRFAPDSTGNALRLAVSAGQDNLESGTWDFYNFLPESYCGTADDDWFDFPHLSLTDNYLYMGANVYDAADAFKCTTMIRISLDDLAAGIELTNPYVSSTLFNFTAAHGGTDTLYFARHEDTTHLRVYTWPESADSAGVTSTLVEHLPFLTGAYDCTVTGTGGRNPCGHDDERVIAAWLRRTNNELGFMWDAPQGTPTLGGQTYPYPYTHVLTMDPATKAVITDTTVWDLDFAWFLPSSGVNAVGDVGGTIARAGGSIYPNCDAWIYDQYTGPSFVLEHVGVTPGAGVPDTDRWGDFLRTRPDSRHPARWLGTCYSLEGTNTVVPRVVRFGREGLTATISGNAGIGGAVLGFDDYVPQNVTANPDGTYSFLVTTGWSGDVTPVLPHYYFVPALRTYVGAVGVIPDQDYLALPYVLFGPDDGSTVCRTPYIVVKLFLSNLTRTAIGAFDLSTVTFELDDGNILNLSSIRVPQTAPHVWAYFLYKPSTDLSLGSHTAEFTHPEVSGTVTDTWNFTAANVACGEPVLLSALADEQAVELQAAADPPVTSSSTRGALVLPVGSSSGTADSDPQQQTASQTESAFRRGRVRDPERRVASQPGALTVAPSSAQPFIAPAFSPNEIVWSGWTMEPPRPILTYLKQH